MTSISESIFFHSFLSIALRQTSLCPSSQYLPRLYLAMWCMVDFNFCSHQSSRIHCSACFALLESSMHCTWPTQHHLFFIVVSNTILSCCFPCFAASCQVTFSILLWQNALISFNCRQSNDVIPWPHVLQCFHLLLGFTLYFTPTDRQNYWKFGV